MMTNLERLMEDEGKHLEQHKNLKEQTSPFLGEILHWDGPPSHNSSEFPLVHDCLLLGVLEIIDDGTKLRCKSCEKNFDDKYLVLIRLYEFGKARKNVHS